MSCLSTFAMACPTCQMSQPTDADMASFPHVFFCSDSPWDPSFLDGEFDATESELPMPLLAASPMIPASMTMVGLSATPLLLTVLLKPALTILVLLSLLLQLRFLPFPRPLFPSFLTSTLCDLILVGFPPTASKRHLMPPLSITVLPCTIPSANILSHVFLPPTSTASPNGLPPILSSLMCPPMMMVSLAMVDAPCCSSMEVSTPTSLPATPCCQKPPCPKLLKILFVIMVP